MIEGKNIVVAIIFSERVVLMSILVCGGAGYIGSHTCVELLQAKYDIIVADNLVNSHWEVLNRIEKITGKKVPFIRMNLCKEDEVNALFVQYPEINAVIHFAGLKAVGESVTKPLEYYSNNLISTLNLLQAMRCHGVKNLIFSSSATVYGDPISVPIREDFPTNGSTNPYGTSKLFQERILLDFCAADPTMNVASLRYFNPIGAHSSGLIGEDPGGIPNNLVPYIAKVAIGQLPRLCIYGDDYPTSDGTGVRDYIHVVDLASGHVAALRKLEKGCGFFVCNLGTGRGYSVLEVLHTYEKICGKKLPYIVCPRRPGDIAECYADVTRAQDELDWKAKFDLEEMCFSSWKWQSMNPNGYRIESEL